MIKNGINDLSRQRFMEKTMPEPNSGCWFWLGRDQGKYGTVRFDMKRKLAHRFSYELFCEPIPEGLEVCHACDTPICVNPDHLFIATHAENMADMHQKKRSKYVIHNGSKNGNSKLTEADIKEIRASTLGYTELARKYGVSDVQIGFIHKRKSWAHIE